MPATTGEVTLGGRAPEAYSEESFRLSVRLHRENDWIFATTVRENLAVANPQASEDLMQECLEAVDFSLGLNVVLSDGAESLSIGQRRRLLLARALCSTAPVLLLDEPTEHISADDARDLLSMLVGGPLPGARAERTAVVGTHLEPAPRLRNNGARDSRD